ncbi:unnamed protein product [Symbiodinium natans]|uniref:Uncharacterized protein n=1 Tax=Symbiodinium natans TaxID=878477 RepID=A0A812UA01_9DINO|nr:unnamed protein product [Symbiodinium natans]
MVRVSTMAGELLESCAPSAFQSVGDLAAHVACKMKAPMCSLTTSAGEKLSPHLTLDAVDEELTAVAEFVDPLLIMLELQEPDGKLLWPNLEELQRAAAKAEEELVRCACGIRAPGHLCGMPSLSWTDPTVPAPPMFLQDCDALSMVRMFGAPTNLGCPMTGDTPVIHAGARVVVVGEQGAGETRKQTVHIRDAPMTLDDLQAIRIDRPDLDDLKKAVAHIDGEVIHPTMKLVSYSRYEITFQLGHERYNWEDL